ncbi:MAG: hypothetical protein MI861_21830, partial [Pirellulales bacterium]|nr:hypothetical protein [Pirellulales bacterium]
MAAEWLSAAVVGYDKQWFYEDSAVQCQRRRIIASRAIFLPPLSMSQMSEIHTKYNEVEKLIDDEKFEEAIVGLKAIVD